MDVFSLTFRARTLVSRLSIMKIIQSFPIPGYVVAAIIPQVIGSMQYPITEIVDLSVNIFDKGLNNCVVLLYVIYRL